MRRQTASDILDLDALVNCVTQSDEFVTEISDSVDKALDGLLEDEKFSEAVEGVVGCQIERMVEHEIEEIDFSDMIKNEMPSYDDDISDLGKEIERLRDEVRSWMDGDVVTELTNQVDELVGLVKGLQEQNHTLFKTLEVVEARNSTLDRSFWGLIHKLRSLPIIGRFFYWEPNPIRFLG